VILSAGLSPAWQQVLVFDRLRLGEVNRAREVHWFPAGKVVNAARAVCRLHRRGLGRPSRGLTILGGPAGEAVRRASEADGIDLAWVPSASPTRICTTIVCVGAEGVTELVENARPVPPGELEEFRRRFRAEAGLAQAVILIGSLPAGVPEDYYLSLLGGVRAPVILDARGPEMLAALEARPLLVKPNREELAKTFGDPLESEAQEKAAMEDLQGRGARWVVVSEGRKGALVLGEGKFLRFRPPAVQALNPIGSGDCMAAGIACALTSGADMVEAIRTGIAAGAENATTLLPADIDGALALRLRSEVVIEKA